MSSHARDREAVGVQGERVLGQVDYSRPAFGWRPELGVKGAKVYLQAKGSDLKPSMIPRALHTPERPPPANTTSHAAPTSLITLQRALVTEIRAPDYLSTMEDGSNMKANTEEGEPRAGRTDTIETAETWGSKVAEKKPNGVAVGGRLRGLQGGRGGKLDGRGAGPQRKNVTTAAGGVGQAKREMTKPARVQDGGVKQVRRVTRSTRGGTAVGKKALKVEEKLTKTRNRQQYLSRKYSVLWGRKVFGRVLPSAARKHHCMRLQRQAFAVWNEQWWSTRREWKLNIRAECHNRYRLWMLVWKGWTEFVRDRKQRKAIKESAASHSGCRLKRKAWRSWCEYLRVRREKTAAREVARQWHVTRTLRCEWMRWRSSLQRKRESDVMSCTAVRHWAVRLQTQAWVCWVEQYRERVAQREMRAVAERHRVLRLEAGCWGAWLTYTEHRRRKKNMTRMAVERHSSSVLARHFTLWQCRLQRAQQLAEFQQLVTERGVRARKRRALTHWRHYVELELYDQYQVQVATSHYHSALMSKAVACLRSYTERQQLQAARKSAASQFHLHKVLHSGWRAWLQRCEHCEEIKMLPLTRKARGHFRNCALRRVFPEWKAFVVLRRHKKAQVTLADQHFKSTALPKCFAAVQSYSAIQCYKRELREQAEGFRRENLMSMVFYKWWRAYHFSLDLHMLERVAILHSEEVVKKSTLKLWRVQTRNKVQQLSCERSAVAHHQRRVLSAALGKWKARWQTRVVSAQYSASALQHHTHRAMRGVWAAWMKYVEQRRESHARCAYGTGHYHRVLLLRAWRGWKVYHCCALRKNEKKIQAHRFYSLTLEKYTLRQWWESVRFHKLQRELEKSALVHFEKTVSLKCFEVWRQRTAESLKAARREREQVHEAVAVLSRAKLARVLAAWRECTNSSVARRIGRERAVVHSNRHLLWNCLTAWHHYHQLALRKMLLSRQSAHFERSRLLSMFYAKWRMELMQAVAMKRKTTLALWHWSQNLQRKALMCWLLYLMNRKRKAERYAQALQRHRSRLLHIGVTQWIKYASSVESQRMESALQHQAQTAQKTMQCVQRCVHRWRAVTRDRMRDRMRMRLSQAKTQAVKAEAHKPTSEDIWTSIARKLQIPDSGSTHRRPQPRKPDYMRSLGRSRDIVLPDCDSVPRLVAPHPPSSPPVLYGLQRQCRQEKEGEAVAATHSFTFLPSSCSEQSLEPRAQAAAVDRLANMHALRPSRPINATIKSSSATARQPSYYSTPVRQAKQHPVLLPPSAFEKPRAETPAEAFTRSRSEAAASASTQTEVGKEPTTHVESRASAGDAQSATGSARPEAAASLDDPAVRSHIVHVRDELRKYHEMKAKQKTLEEQIARAGMSSDASTPAELQAELSRTVADLCRNEPLILHMVSQVRGLFSENQGN